MIDIFSRKGFKMNVDSNKLATHFAKNSFQVEGVYHYLFEPGWSGWQKTLPYPGFLFQLKGNTTLIFNNTPYELNSYSIIHGGANMSLDMKVNGTTRWEYILVLYQLNTQELNDYGLSNSHFQLQTGENSHLTELLWSLWKSFQQPDSLSKFQTEMFFRCVLNEVFISMSNPSKQSSRELFEHISLYIQEHYFNYLTIPLLANQFNLNANKLSYLFYKYAGMGPGDYLLQYRLNRAKELLLASNAPLRDIAQATGFNDPFYFSKAFKKQFSIPPSKFREKFRNNTC